ncbi:MAG: DMT family transporter [Acidimicrobiia bacterium]|nr:DMT family transporter [Acidimicrobiia bacterium]
MNIKIWLAFGVAAFGWGTAGVGVRAAFDEGLDPLALVALRSIIAAIAIFAYLVFVRGSVPRSREEWKMGTVMSLFNLTIPFILFTIAIENVSAGFMGLLPALIPLTTAVFAHFLIPEEPLHTGKVVGLVVAFAGVGFLSLTGDSGLEEGGRPELALLLGGAGVVFIGIANIYAKKRAAGYDPVEVTGMQFAIGALIMIVVTAVWEGYPTDVTAIGWLLVMYLAIIGSVVPFLAYYWVLKHVTVTRAQAIAYLVPLVALSSGIVVLDEKLEIGIAVGGVLILLGVLLTGAAEKRFVRV